MSTYKRVLLKVSGEQLSGKFEVGIDSELAKWLANEIKSALSSGVQLVIVAGGGNMVRGEEVAKHGIKRPTADQMGMLSGLINSMALTDIFEENNLPTRCLTNIFVPQAAESYSFRLAEKHLQKGKVVIVAGGIGRPYFTHDTAAINLALELSCDAVFKATKVDGVYDMDPNSHENAVRLTSLSFKEAAHNEDIKVMDQAALALAMDHRMPIVVYNFMQPGALGDLLHGQAVGTKIS